MPMRACRSRSTRHSSPPPRTARSSTTISAIAIGTGWYPPDRSRAPRARRPPPRLFRRLRHLHHLLDLLGRQRPRHELVLDRIGEDEIETLDLVGPHRGLREEFLTPDLHPSRRDFREFFVGLERLVARIHVVDGVPVTLHEAGDEVLLRQRLQVGDADAHGLVRPRLDLAAA